VIVVDSSVWIDFFRASNPVLGHQLQSLLDADEVALAVPVRIEILSGASTRNLPSLKRVLSALPLFYPTDESWARIDTWVEIGLRSGERFGFGDLLIAAIAVDHQASVWSLDDDFHRMARLGWIDLH